MAKSNDSWGIEVGANAIKAMRLARAGKDVELVEYDVLPFKHVLTTPDTNVDEAIQVNLDALMSKHDLSKSNVVISVPGHLAFARFAKLPPVEPKKIPDIVRFEAVQQIPFPIDQVEWDYQVFQQEDSPDVEVGIFAITKERVMNFLANYRHVGMHIDALTLSPLAVYNAFAFEGQGEEETDGTIYMDIGTQSTDLIIVESGGIWLRTLPIGGNNFTEALVKAFKLSFSKAEKLKREAGTSKYARQIFQAMRPVFADLVQEMQRSLGYYQSLNRDAELKRLVGVGSTFRLPGLQKFLKQQLQMEVVRPDGFKRISVDGKQAADFAENALNMATAYGLALQGLGVEAVSANVLPQHILRARMWKAKQPWIAAAAACIAAASGLAGARYFMEASAYDSAFQETNGFVTGVIGDAQQLVRQWDEIGKDSDPRMQIENLRRVLDYRDLWPKLLEDVTAAAASLQPDPVLMSPDYDAIGAIPPEQRAKLYIESISAQYIPETIDLQQQQQNSRERQRPTDRLGGDFDISTFFGEGKAPKFEITLRGSTPLADAPARINSTFINWLRENGERPDRPYRIVVPANPIPEIWRIEPQVVETGRAGGRTGRSPGRGSTPLDIPYGPFGPGGMPPDMGMPPEMGMPPDMMYGRGGTGRSGTPSDVQALLPNRPPVNSTVPMTGFQIKWVVELLPPDAARQAELADEAPAAPTPPQPQVDAPDGETQPEQAAKLDNQEVAS